MIVVGEGEAAQPPTQMLEGHAQLLEGLLAGESRQQEPGARVTSCPILARTLTPANALRFLAIGACAELAGAAARYVDAHFTEVAQTQSFAALEADALASLLQRDTIEVSSEVLLDAVLRWTRHAPATRVEQLGTLLRHLRLHLPPHVNVAGVDAGAASRYMRRARSAGHAVARGAERARTEGRRLISIAKRAVGAVRRAWRHYRPGAAVRAACAALVRAATANRRLALPPPRTAADAAAAMPGMPPPAAAAAMPGLPPPSPR